jgi:hypothetical protein
MTRTVTGALSVIGLMLALLGVVAVFVSAPVGLGLGVAAFVLSGGWSCSATGRRRRETLRRWERSHRR